MTEKKKHGKFSQLPVYQKWQHYARHHTFPGSGGKTIFTVLQVMAEGFRNSVLAMRASALAFKFMMAAIPALILMNTVLPVLLTGESKDVLFQILREFLPAQIFGSIQQPVSQVSKTLDGGVISLTAFAALYFAVNGMRASMVIFNNSFHIRENRPLFKQFAVAFLMVGILVVIAVVAALVFLLNQNVVVWMQGNEILSPFWTSSLVFFIKYTFFFLFLTLILSWLYFLAPAARTRFHLFSPGSVIASFFSVLVSVGFDAFIANFTKYHEVYGGISALFILMLFLFLLSLIFLTGFEINAALYFGVHKVKTNEEQF